MDIAIVQNLMSACNNLRTSWQVEGICDRGVVAAMITDIEGQPIGSGVNQRLGVCDCNDGADTSVKGSSTCQATHAELVALQNMARAGWLASSAKIAVVTRPPCKVCANHLLFTLPELEWLVTTDEFPDRDDTLKRFRERGISVAILKDGQY